VVGVRLLGSNLRKLLRRPASWVSFLLLVGLEALIFVAVGATVNQQPDREAAAQSKLLVTFPGAYELILGFIFSLGGLLALTYGAAVAGSEWTWGTLKAAVARGEARSIYTLLTYAGVVVFTLLGILLAFLAGIVAAVLGATLAGVPLDGLGDTAALGHLPDLYWRGGLGLAMDAAIGFAIATIARSQLAGIGVGIGLYFGAAFATLFLRDVVKWLPFQAASALLGGAEGTATGAGNAATAGLDATTALVVVVAWLLGALVLSSLWTERAEIAG
jgi:hypothetical protein